MTIKNRVRDLEKTKRTKEPQIIIVDWGEEYLIVDGEKLSREEVHRRYPNEEVIKVEYIETPYPGEAADG